MNQIDLDGRTAIVTGAAGGIGSAIVRRFLDSGAKVDLWDIDGEALRIVSRELGGADAIKTTEVDLRDPEAVHEAARSTNERFGSIEILVNNAGIAGPSKKLWECSPAEWREVIDVNLWAVFVCCHAVVPLMLPHNYGRIVNVASIAGKEGNPNASHYSATKAGVIGLTKSLGKELARTEIKVNCITPAVVQTNILKQVSQEHIDYMVSKIPMGRLGQKEEIAALVAWLCSEECSFSTGAVFDVSGGRATY